MIIAQLFKKFNFYDSLLERVSCDLERKEVVLEIDFCYWQQVDYRDDMPETGLVRLVFSCVSAFEFDPYEICSDEIVKVACSDADTVLLEVYNDCADEYHTIRITADNVDFIELDWMA